MIDGILVEIKIIEEWGLNIGEDACLFNDNEDQKSQSDIEEAQGDPKACKEQKEVNGYGTVFLAPLFPECQ